MCKCSHKWARVLCSFNLMPKHSCFRNFLMSETELEIKVFFLNHKKNVLQCVYFVIVSVGRARVASLVWFPLTHWFSAAVSEDSSVVRSYCGMMICVCRWKEGEDGESSTGRRRIRHIRVSFVCFVRSRLIQFSSVWPSSHKCQSHQTGSYQQTFVPWGEIPPDGLITTNICPMRGNSIRQAHDNKHLSLKGKFHQTGS